MKAITKGLKKVIKCLGYLIFVRCWRTVYIELDDFWPFYKHSLKHKSHFFCLNVTRNQQEIPSLSFSHRLRVKIWRKEARVMFL